MIFRVAEEADIEQIQHLRHFVNANISTDTDPESDKDMASRISEKGKGWICLVKGQLAGFAIVDLKEKYVWALSVHPEYTENEIEKKLHRLMASWYFEKTKDKLTLRITPDTLTEQFYELQGWSPAVNCDTSEISMELNYSDWQKGAFFNRDNYSVSR
ncbi:GNAT family N-acetyltransferase [Sphingobacterium spiritivorum]|uniref:GNAT family N-acetyltransferase n=1 Tax=Sphingobacterium spiritivorum TaxID=258 RepID=UPI003DA5F40E